MVATIVAPARISVLATPLLEAGIRSALVDHPDFLLVVPPEDADLIVVDPSHVLDSRLLATVVPVLMLALEPQADAAQGFGDETFPVLPCHISCAELAASLVAALDPAGAARDGRAISASGRPDTGAVHLSPREGQVLELICRGVSNTEIADHLFLSINSIKTHIRNLYRKIAVERRPQAIIWGMGHGFGTAHAESVKSSR